MLLLSEWSTVLPYILQMRAEPGGCVHTSPEYHTAMWGQFWQIWNQGDLSGMARSLGTLMTRASCNPGGERSLRALCQYSVLLKVRLLDCIWFQWDSWLACSCHCLLNGKMPTGQAKAECPPSKTPPWVPDSEVWPEHSRTKYRFSLASPSLLLCDNLASEILVLLCIYPFVIFGTVSILEQ